MRALIVCTLLLLWALPALAEQKPAPDGFGPIKFGMTKEEAWEAIGGQGEWQLEGKILNYQIILPSISLNLKEFEVNQHFNGDVATYVEAIPDTEHDSFLSCIGTQAKTAAYISNRYDKVPVYSEETRPGSTTERYIGYNFAFDGGARIELYVLLYRLPSKDEECHFYIHYDPVSELMGREPPEKLLPF